MAVKKYPVSPKAEKIAGKPVVYNMDAVEPPNRVTDFEVAYNTKPFYTDAIGLLNKAKKGLNAKSALDFLSLSGFTQDVS